MFLKNRIYTEKNKYEENLHVYDALRAEIIQMEESQTTYTVYMYTVFFAAFTFGFQFRALFLLAQVVLIIFQSLINYRVWLRYKTSAYIISFFEKSRSDIHWESLHCSSEYFNTEFLKRHLLSMWIAEHASGVLACIATIVEICLIVADILENGGLFVSQSCLRDIYLVGELIIALLLCSGVLVVVYQYDHEKDPKLQDIMDEYRKNQFTNSKSPK